MARQLRVLDPANFKSRDGLRAEAHRELPYSGKQSPAATKDSGPYRLIRREKNRHPRAFSARFFRKFSSYICALLHVILRSNSARDAFSINAVRYIHSKSVPANLVRTINAYERLSHHSYSGECDTPWLILYQVWLNSVSFPLAPSRR